MDNATAISIIICTYNRMHSLSKTLESLVSQYVPDGTNWEIVVVDNNSTDSTQQVIEDFQSRFQGRFRSVRELQQGISFARNRGIRESRGEVLAFIDDDEIATPGWLEKLTANLFSGEWAGSGGPVVSQWNRRPPTWWSDKSPFTLGPLAAWGADPKVKTLVHPPVGANMAFRRETFDKFGGFRTDLGRVGGILLHGEDTEFGRRLMDAGLKLRYEPAAVTLHPVDESRISKKYFLDWWFNKGKSDIREFGDQKSGIHLFSIPIGIFRDIVVEAIRWAITLNPARKFICRLKLWTYAGAAVEYHRLSSSSK